MLKEQAKLFRAFNIIVDVAALIIGFCVAHHQWTKGTGAKSDIFDFLWILLVILPVWLTLLNRYGFYLSKRASSISSIAWDLFKVNLIGGIFTSSVIFFLKHAELPREYFLQLIFFIFISLTFVQLMTRTILKVVRCLGYNYRNIILVGAEDEVQHLTRLVEVHGDWGIRILGIIFEGSHSLSSFQRYPILGLRTDLQEICKKHPVDEVIICTGGFFNDAEIERLVVELEQMGITVRMALNFYLKFNIRKDLSLFHGEVPLMTFYPRTFDAGPLFLKRCIDVVGAFVGLSFTALLFPFIALAIKIDSPGPVIFGQTRVRENGRTFTCWKFRSMYADAEARKNELSKLNEMSGAIFKIKNDPRITRVGHFLRKTSLDELPQFWNVLCGEMSLVGTRPPTPDEVEKYENWQRKRICIKPGITGMWQVNGRNRVTDFNEVVRLDLDYIERWSLSLDFYLLLKTFKAVFAKEGC